MPKYVIERSIPGAGSWTPEQLQKTSTKSREVLQQMGGDVQWLESYVTDDKLYCVYVAPNEDIILDHARCGGFPADTVKKVSRVIDPSTGE